MNRVRRYKGTAYTSAQLDTLIPWWQEEGMSLARIAAILGVTRSTLNRWGFHHVRTIHRCPDCGEPKTRNAIRCRACRKTVHRCPSCGGPRSFSAIRCRACHHRQQGNYNAERAVCSKCKRNLPLTAFYQRTDPRFTKPVRAHCKRCEKEDVAKRRREDPRKPRAHSAVARAIKIGELVREPCEVCGKEPAQAHHENYDRPLDVRWLCVRHHLVVCPSDRYRKL